MVLGKKHMSPMTFFCKLNDIETLYKKSIIYKNNKQIKLTDYFFKIIIFILIISIFIIYITLNIDVHIIMYILAYKQLIK